MRESQGRELEETSGDLLLDPEPVPKHLAGQSQRELVGLQQFRGSLQHITKTSSVWLQGRGH